MDSREDPTRTIKFRSRVIPVLVSVLFIVQLLFPNKGWMILLSGLGAAWLFSYLWARSLKDGLRLARDLRFDWKQVGDHLHERITVMNDGWAPGLWIRVIDQSDMQDYEISTVMDVQSRMYRHRYTRGICTSRGLYTLGPTSLEAGDPLGMYSVRVDYAESVNMMVVPQVIPLPEIEIAPGGRIGEGHSHFRSIEQTVTAVGVREYIPGDSLRWIHWPTTARKEEPYVHLFDYEPSSDWWVVLDMDPGAHVGEGQRSTEEYGVILAASLVNRGLQMGKAVGFISHGDDLLWHVPDLGDNHLWKIMRSLASVRPGGPSIAELLGRIRGSLGQRVSLVVITPNLSPEWLNALELLQRSGIVPTVILLDPVSFGGDGNINVVRDRLLRLGVTHYIVNADLFDPPGTPSDEPRDWWLVSTESGSSSRGDRKPFWRKLGRTLWSGVLIFLMFASVVSTLGNEVHGVEKSLLWYTASSGMLLGWLLASTSLPGWASAILGGGLGIGLTLFSVGRLGNMLLAVFSRLPTFIYQTIQWLIQDGNRPEAQPLQIGFGELWEKLSLLATRLWTWVLGVSQGESYFDPVAVAFIWGIMVWGSAAWAMRFVFKNKRPILGVLPAVSLVAISLAYIQTTSYDLALMLGVMITLTVLVRHDVRERFWEKNRLYYDTTIRQKIIIAAIALALGLMIFSIVTPSISVSSIEEFIYNLGTPQSDSQEMVRSFGLGPESSSETPDILDIRRSGSLPNNHLLGAEPELSDQVVMVVQFEAWQGEESIDAAFQLLPSHRYIRNLTYDRYTGLGWESRETQIINYDAGERILSTWPENYRLVRQQINVVEDLGGLMHAVGTPINADQDFSVAWRLRGVETGVFDIFGAIIEGETYQVDSIIPAYSAEELSKAGQNYPEWIRDRYMGLPSSVPDRVLALARELTATEPTPYDRALALERYLRQFPYTLDVTMPPLGRDSTEYFLFVLQKGYCDYYATAMVVLARAAGLPARLVTGYIAENYDEARSAYIITADQAHAWTEIYFPGYGWITFEPTSGRSKISRPSEPLPEVIDEFLPNLEPRVADRLSPRPWLKMIGLSILSVVGVVVIVWKVSDWWLVHIPLEKLISKLYTRLYRYGRWIGIPTRPGETPYEFVDDLIHHIQSLAMDSYLADWLLKGGDAVQELTDDFIVHMYNPSRRHLLNRSDIIQAYKVLRNRLWMLWLLRRAYDHRIFRPLFWRRPPVLILSDNRIEE